MKNQQGLQYTLLVSPEMYRAIEAVWGNPGWGEVLGLGVGVVRSVLLVTDRAPPETHRW